MRIAVIGAGALGSFYGARLHRAGFDVRFLMRGDFQAVSERGLEIRSKDGDFHITPDVYRTPEEIGIVDLVLVGLKTVDNTALETLLPPLCNADTAVLTLQNGLGNEDNIVNILSRHFPSSDRQVIGGIAFLCCHRVAPGVINHTDHGWIRVGEFSGPARPRTEQIREMFEHAGIHCEIYDSLMQARWEKLVWNIPFNGLGVAAHASTDIILDDPELKQLAAELMQEVVAAATAQGIALQDGIAEKMLRNTITMGAYKTSMQLDHQAGRPLEVESILGEPLRRGQKANCSMPHLEMLYALVRHIGEAAAG